MNTINLGQYPKYREVTLELISKLDEVYESNTMSDDDKRTRFAELFHIN